MLDSVKIDYVMTDPRSGKRKGKPPIAPYGLALLLAQTPKTINGIEIEAHVHDEQTMDPYDVSKSMPDIVCLSYLSTGANRAYRISYEANESRGQNGKNIFVIHGGVHATSLPREAIESANIVVRGEVTPDFQYRILERALKLDPNEKIITRLNEVPQTLNRPPADWNWINPKNYVIPYSIQTSVGCPFSCSFCSVTEIFGAVMRTVDQECLSTELEKLPKSRAIAIIDDNFLQGTGSKHINHCLMVADLLARSNRKWVAELTPSTLIKVQETMKPKMDFIGYLAKKGCLGLFFGIETVEENGAGLAKLKDMAKIDGLIRNCHDHGIMVLGAFVLGLSDDETTDHAQRIVDAAINWRLDYAQFSINTPMPGAKNFIAAAHDGTIIDYNWDHYDAGHCVFRHPKMTPDQLEEALDQSYRDFYGWRSINERQIHPLLGLSLNNWHRIALSLPINIAIGWAFSKNPPRPVPLIKTEPNEAVLIDLSCVYQVKDRKAGQLFKLGDPDDISVPID